MSDESRNFRLSKDVLPSTYALGFELDFDNWTSTGWERIALRTSRPAREIVLHSLELDIKKATLDGQVAERTSSRPASRSS
jgi:aminopeptidase N